MLEVEGYVIEQHKLGFDKALQQAKYFYKIPLDEGNFEVDKIFTMVSLSRLTKFLMMKHQKKELCMVMNMLMPKDELALTSIFCNNSWL